jgi:methyl-accepting chemotaxis protein
MNHMSVEHDRGDIDVFVPVDKFQGSFAEMAKGLNTMVTNHIAAKKKAMACIKQFGEGNFNAPMEQLPGKKAFINDTIELLRANFQAIIGEIQRLIMASTAGQLSERGDAARFPGDFGQLIGGINGMLDAILLPIGEGNRVLNLVSTGSLVERVEIDCEGDHRRMRDAINNLVDNLTSFATNVSGAAEQVAAGSQQLSSASEQVSEGATEQAAAAEEASASMEQMARTSNRTPTTRPRPRRSPASRRAMRKPAGSRCRRPWSRCARSPRRSASSRRSLARPTCWRSTRRSRRRVPASMAAASRWSPPKCASWPSAARLRRPRSAACRPTPSPPRPRRARC